MRPPNVHRFAGQSANNSNYLNDNFDLVLGGNFTHNTAYDSLSRALADFGSDSKTLYVSSEVSITSSATIPSNVSIEVLKGGFFNIAPDVTLTITGEFAAGNYQVFKGAGVVVFSGQKKPILNPLWWGALGDGTTDDSLAILSMYNSIRSAGGVVSFPQLTYRTAYGFWLPANTLTLLNGSTIKALTTYGQGSIPTHALAACFFVIGGSITSNAVQASDYSNIKIIGGGATLDGNALNQTGTPPGYNGILMETSPTPIEDNFLRIKNIHIEDLTVTHMYHYGVYLEGVDNCTLYNVKALYAGANGISIIGGRNIALDTVQASNTRGPNAVDSSYGFGFWNEPNNTWQTLENCVYVSCYAEYNYQGGFLAYNPGQDANYDVRFIGCKSYRNSWDGSAHRSAVDASGFSVSIATNYAENYSIEFESCLAIEEFQSGFKVKRGGGGQANALIRFKNCTAFHCITDDADGYERAGISVVGTSIPSTRSARVEIDSPTVIAPPANTLGYLIGALYSQDVYISNPTYKGPATYNAILGNPPTTRFTSSVPNVSIDPAGDEKTGGITGSGTKFYKPIRLASFDQTAEPTDIHLNELVVWQNDNDVFVGIFLNDDTLKRYVPMIDGLPGANQLVKGTAAGDGWKQSAVTIDENNIIDNVERINVNGAVDNSGAVVNAVGNISAAGTINSYGLGVPGSSDIERAIMLHDGATADIRSLASGTGTVRPLRLVVGSTAAVTILNSGRVGVLTASPAGPLHVVGDSSGNVAIFAKHSGDAVPALLLFRKSRGSEGSPANVQNADVLGEIDFLGYGSGIAGYGGSGIQCYVDGAPGTGIPPTAYAFYSNEAGSAAAIRLTIRANGDIEIAGNTIISGNLRRSSQTGITASTTQTQGQQPLTKDINIVSTVANANDTVTMPSAAAGMSIFIRNNGAQTLQIFPASGDNINGTGVNTAVTLAANASVTYHTADTTNWYS